MKFIILCTFMAAINAAWASDTITHKGERAIEFTATDQRQQTQTVAAWAGQLSVTENRHKPDSRHINLHYVRFPSTSDNPGPPIVYLAGGPGGSGIATAKNRRFDLFMALREVADVIALDQRGTGQSNDLPDCQSQQFLPQDRPLSDPAYINLNRQALHDCFAFWQQQGVDLSAYNTLASVADLDDLRRHLGAEKISLWGISYGSHLALAALKTIPDRLHKVIMASAEGLDQTIKYPARTDAYFVRFQHHLNANNDQPTDIKALMQKVHRQLDQEPVELQWQNDRNQAVTYYLQTRDMQQIAAYMIADPDRAQQLLLLYHAVAAGIHAPVQNIIQRHMNPEQAIGFSPMSTAMDLASGIGADRLAQIKQQTQSALLGGYLNFSWHFTDMAIEQGLDLGDDFRSLPRSDVPTLLLSGTLDGRTYLESQTEAVQGLSHLTHIKVLNAGHNLFKSSPAVIKNMLRFMRDLPIEDLVITAQP